MDCYIQITMIASCLYWKFYIFLLDPNILDALEILLDVDITQFTQEDKVSHFNQNFSNRN